MFGIELEKALNNAGSSEEPHDLHLKCKQCDGLLSPLGHVHACEDSAGVESWRVPRPKLTRVARHCAPIHWSCRVKRMPGCLMLDNFTTI